MSVKVEISIQGDLYPSQRNVAEKIIVAAADAAGLDIGNWQVRETQVRNRDFFGPIGFTRDGEGSKVNVEFYFHVDP